MRFVLVHGFNVKDAGAGSVGLFRAPLQKAGHPVAEMHYGRRWWPLAVDLLAVRFANGERAETLKKLCAQGLHPKPKTLHPSCVVLAHSNGAAIALEAAKRGAAIERMVLVNPALDTDAVLPPQVRRVDVFHTPWDLPTRISTYLLRHPWGRMGALGHRGSDRRWINWEMSSGTVRRGGEDRFFRLPGWNQEYAVRGHSAVFDRGQASWHFWYPVIFHALLGSTGYWDWDFPS